MTEIVSSDKIDNKNINEALREFAQRVVFQSRRNLTKGGKNFTKELWNSINSSITVNPNSFGLQFFMSPHGVFQDRGVKGTKSGRSLDNFRFKESSNLVGVEYHTGALSKWAKHIGIRSRDKKGRFGSYKTMGYILANTIKKKGIKPSLFFTKPFESEFNNLPDELIEAYGLDLEAFLNLTITDNLT
jgi:hypothetical protein